MRRVLVFADIFPPAFAPRAAYLVKYLPRFGWEPYIISERIPEVADHSHGNVFEGFSFEVPVVRVDVTSSALPAKVAQPVRMLGELLAETKEKRFLKRAEQAFPDVAFDAVLCMTYRKFPLAAAYRYARAHRLPWIADCRDIIEQYSNYDFLPRGRRLPLPLMKLLRSRYIALRNRYLHRADKVISVSPWHCRLLSVVNPRAELIYNGYDPELFYPSQSQSEKFIISYTGRLLSREMHDPTLLFQALAGGALKEQRRAGKVELHWYVDAHSQSILRPLMEQYELTDICCFFPMVPATQVASILHRSSVLLQLGNTEKTGGPHGIVSTKLFESLAVEKPILMVRSDEAVVAEMIAEARAGFAARTVEEVTAFLEEQYAHWEAVGDTTLSNPNRAFVSTFSRVEQAGQFARLLESVVSSK